MLFALTPDQKAAGNLKNKNLFKFDAENSITLYFSLMYKKILCTHNICIC
ncbi:hypothetical protein FPC840_1830001 [Flavobacterium psychrophilum]|nr:hypothetical protein FPC840_1830001 [Flavobacterium psychrophilum]